MKPEAVAPLLSIENIRKTGILTTERALDPLFRAAICLTLVMLADLLSIANEDGQRLVEAEDIYPTGNEKDLTSLLMAARNAAVHHRGSGHNRIGEMRSIFHILEGGTRIRMNGKMITIDREGDVAINFGEMIVYLEAHILFAIDHLNEMYLPDYYRVR